MTVDSQRLHERVSRLEAQVAELRQIVYARAAVVAAANDAAKAASETVDRVIAAGVVCPLPDRVAEYLRAHPDATDIVTGMAGELVREFQGEHAEIELDLYEDPEIDDQYLAFTVRKPTYEDKFVDRLLSVMAKFHEERGSASGWVMVSTDFRPLPAP